MSTINFERIPVVWRPTESTGQQTRKLWRYISEKYNVKLENYWDLYEWSLNNLEDFYAEMWEKTGIIASRPYEKVLDTSVSFADGPEWFLGARLNFAENLLKHQDSRVAIIATGEDREVKKYTYAELYAESCRYNSALRKLGLVQDDRVVCYMSNREQAIFAMVGSVAAGAIFSAALPYLAPEVVSKRFKTISPKFFFTIDGYTRNNQVKEMLDEVKQIVDSLPSLEKVIIIPSKPESREKNISNIRNSCFLEEFLVLGENLDSVPEIVFEQLPFSHPVFIEYSTGTTGDPKAVVHGCGGLLSVAREYKLLCSEEEGSIWLSILPAGCITWSMFSTLLVTGFTMVMYEGVPFHPNSTTKMWDLVDEFSISHLFLATYTLDEMEKRKYIPGQENSLASLTTIFSSGSLVSTRNYDFIYNHVKKDVTFAPIFGCTESMGASTVIERTLPIYLGEIQAPALGMNVSCYNEEGKPVLGEIGELVLTAPSPSLPLFLWGDKNRTLYKETYFNKYKDAFSLGDLAIINPVTRGAIAIGRRDTIFKRGGSIFGPMDIYNVVEKLEDVMDCLCVSQSIGNNDERMILFVHMQPGCQFTDKLQNRIRADIEKALTKNHIPDVIVEADDIPRSMVGKKLEVLVKKIINKEPYNSDYVRNPGCLQFYENFAKL